VRMTRMRARQRAHGNDAALDSWLAMKNHTTTSVILVDPERSVIPVGLKRLLQWTTKRPWTPITTPIFNSHSAPDCINADVI
jgi:hypothetical protein